MKNLLRLLFFLLIISGGTAKAQTILAQSGTAGNWRSFNLADPPGPPWPFSSYTGQPAGWQSCSFNDASWNINPAGSPMWVTEPPQVHGALFRTTFNLTSVSGVYYFKVLPNNECSVTINGVTIGGLYNWVNGLVTVCVPSQVMHQGSNCIAMQVTEWLDDATTIDFTLYNDNTNAVIAQPNQTFCSTDAPFTFTATPAGGSWSGTGINASTGVFTPAPTNIGSNTLTYSTILGGAGGCPVSDTVNATVKNCNNCSDSCYWKVTGNSIINGNNIFGTITNDDVRIKTNNTAVGIITKTGRYGFGNLTTPGNVVEIVGPTPAVTGTSGLRFNNLNSSSATAPNPGTVLSLNATGDVVLVPDNPGGGGSAANGLSLNGTTVQLGQDCNGGSGADLLNDRSIPMNDNNIVFMDGKLQRKQANRLGLGILGCIPGAKLDVLRNQELGVYETYNKTISGVNADIGQQRASGVYGESNNPKNRVNIGGDFLGRNGQSSTMGVMGVAQGQQTGQTYGGNFYACGGNQNFGVYATACGGTSTGSDWAGYFNGDVYCSTGNYVSSDLRLKQNIEPISNALDLLQQLQPKKYQFNTEVYPALHLPSGQENYGVIAQDLEKVLPSLVKETPVPAEEGKEMTGETIKTVNYTALIPILIQAVKDQQQQINDLTAKLTTATGNQAIQNSSVSHLDLILSDKDIAVLDQNYPNPFDKFTAIGYYIPENVGAAIIQFSSLDGKVVKSIEIPSRGKGLINVYTSELNTGTYVYTLLADGKVIDTKKMQIVR